MQGRALRVSKQHFSGNQRSSCLCPCAESGQQNHKSHIRKSKAFHHCISPEHRIVPRFDYEKQSQMVPGWSRGQEDPACRGEGCEQSENYWFELLRFIGLSERSSNIFSACLLLSDQTQSALPKLDLEIARILRA